MNEPRIMISLEQLDAIELAEICGFLADWLSVAPEAAGSFDRHVGQPGQAQDLCGDLLRFKTLIETAPGSRR